MQLEIVKADKKERKVSPIQEVKKKKLQNRFQKTTNMKSKLLYVVIAASVLLLASCKKDSSSEEPSGRQTYYVAQGGSRVTNPVNSDYCKQAQASQTLQSLRLISGLVYRMDYCAPNMMDDFVNADIRTSGRRDSLINEWYFTPEGWEGRMDFSGACSGFVCKNEKGDLLFCRNFDGSDGDCLVLFDRVNGYKKVMLTAPFYSSPLYMSDNALSNGTSSLHRLMRQPFVAMDGMNEYGLCYGAFQLPSLASAYPESERAGNNPDDLNQNTGKKAIHSALFHNLILSRCKTVREVEALLAQYDMVGVIPHLNVHWLIADATGDWAIFEYWKNELHVYREEELKKPEMLGGREVPYEWCSIENYYRNPELVATYNTDNWQKEYSPKVRIEHMMKAYKPVMTLEEALACSQEGIFSLEPGYEDMLTNWSCIYNPKERTIHFYNRNDVTKLYVVDLKKDL